MKHSETIANLAAALVKAHGQLRAIGKDAVNPHFKNTYASLDGIIESVRPVLAANALAVSQGATTPITDEAGHLCGFAVETMLIHSSGEWLTNTAVMPFTKADPQGAGGALTYGRRYGLSALLCLATEEDDDGNTASPRTTTAPAQRAATTTQTAAPGRAAAPSPINERAPLDEPAQSATDDPACPKCGGKVWNNTLTKKSPKQPDYVCRNKGTCPGVIWPARQPVASVADDDLPWERA